MTDPSDIVFTCADFHVETIGDSAAKKFRVQAANATGVLALDEQGRILMTREYRPKNDKVFWRIPAGRCEPGEALIAAARRELREESGFDATELLAFFAYESLSSWVMQEKAFFTARGLFASPLDTGDEVVKPEVHFLTPAAVLKLLNDGDIFGDIAAALYRFLHVQKLI